MLNSVQSRLSVALLPVIAFFITLGTAVWVVSESTANDIGETVRRNTLVAGEVQELSILAQQIRRYEKEYFIYVGDTAGRSKYRNEWSQTHEKMAQQIKAMVENAQSLFSAQEVNDLQIAGDALDFYGAEMNKIFGTVDDRVLAVEQYVTHTEIETKPAAKNGTTLASAPQLPSPSDANTMIREGKDRLGAELIKPLADISKARQRDTLALPEVSRKGFSELAEFVVILSGLGILVTVAVMLLLPRTLRAPLTMLTAQVEALSKGRPIGGDEIGVKEFRGLAQAVNRMSVAQKLLLERLKPDRPTA